MKAISRLVAIGALALSISPFPASAGSPVTTMSPFYPPIYGAPNQPAPYWATPYWATPGTLSVTPGTTFYPSNSPNLPQQYANPALNRVPFGARARIIMIYLQTQSIRSGSREVQLGRSMRDWMGRMGLAVGGETARALRDQARRISACHIRFFWSSQARLRAPARQRTRSAVAADPVALGERAPPAGDHRVVRTMVGVYCASYAKPPAAVTLDIDDTCVVVHGHQQLSLFNAHYGERCFLPIHVYDTETSRPVAVLLRPGKTPSEREVRGHLRRLVRLIRRHWPKTRLTIRGDGHYGRPEVMAWCEDQGIDFVRGLPGNDVLRASVDAAADDVRTRRAEQQTPVLRGYTDTRYAARSWTRQRRAVARIEATTLSLDIRFVVTSLQRGSAELDLRHALLCARAGGEPDQDAQGSTSARLPGCGTAMPGGMLRQKRCAPGWRFR